MALADSLPGREDGGNAPVKDGFLLTRVTLAGFGVYERPAAFHFPGGPATLCGPNESGKSTLLNGLAAVLFGLPSRQDPSGFGSGRFRSFSHPREFWGEVEWRAGGRTYRLHRAFESHRVRLIEEGAKGPHVIFEGEHNPKATSSSGSAFLEHLERHFGLASLELFQQTFYLTQPLAEETGISTDLQRLLSGSRSGHKDEVLCRLFDRIKDLTKTTGDLALVRPGRSRPANQRDDGRIEKLQKELESAVREQEEGASLLEELNANNQEMEAAQEAIRAATTSLSGAERRIGNLRDWMTAYMERRRRSESLPGIQQMLAELDGIEVEKAKLAPLLGGPYARFEKAPEELAAQLEELEAALTEVEARRTGMEEAQKERLSLAAQAAELEAELGRDFRDVRGRPELPEIRERLAAAVAREEARAQATLQAGEKLQELRRRLADAGEELNPEALRLQAGAYVRDFSRLEAIERRSDEIARQSEERSFLRADRMQALRERIAAGEKLRELGLRIRECELRVAALGTPGAASAPAPGIAGRLLPWILGLAGAGAARFLFHQGWAPSGAAGALIAALLWAAAFLLRRRKAQVRPPEVPAPAAQEEPPAEALARLRAEEAALRTRAEEWDKDLGPYALLTRSELDLREERWRLFDAESEKLRAEENELRARWLPSGPAGGEASLQEPDWRTFPAAGLSGAAPLLGLAGAPAGASSLGLLAWLRELPQAAWQKLAESAAQTRAWREQARQTEKELERLRTEDDGEESTAHLRERLAPFDLATPVEEIRARLDQCEQRERSLRRLHDRLEEIPPAEAQAAVLEQARSRTQDLWRKLQQAWPAAETDAAAGTAPVATADAVPSLDWIRRAREEERAARLAWLKSGELEASRRRILSSAQVQEPRELVQKQIEATAALGLVIREMETLEAKEIWLTAGAEQEEMGARALRLSRLQQEAELEYARSHEGREKLKERLLVILQQEAALKGRSTSNLAQLEMRIARARKELQFLLQERDSLVLAFRWVEEAAGEYARSYREELESRITERFLQLTAGGGRRVLCDESFALSLRGAGGEEIAIVQLSQGARDQLSLAVRLAAADLLTGAAPLPLFFDDPFLHYDAGRLARLRETLELLGRDRQWILLTHRAELAAWAQPVVQEDPPPTAR